MEGIFYSRKPINENDFCKEEIVNSGYSEGNGNKNVFISEIKPSFIEPPIDNGANVAAVWQKREGNNEVIKFAFRGGTNQVYAWCRDNRFDINVPTNNPFNLQAKGFFQEKDYSLFSENFFL